MVHPWALRVLLAFDQLGNVLLLRGHEDETISSNCGKRVRAGTAGVFCRWLCRLLDVVDPGHCQDAIEEDEGLNYEDLERKN